MDRLTTDHPYNNLSALLNYAYAKDQRVVLSFAGGEENIDLCDYISKEAQELQFDCHILAEDVMEGGCSECDCPMAALNIAAVQAAELRGRLKKIEDILGDTYDLEQLQELMEGHKNPKPLTIEELMQMPGEPVWIRKLDSDKAFWMLAYPDIVSNRIGYLEYRGYGIEWIAFRQKPEA